MRRTSCKCKLCQHGCKTMPGYLIPSDLVHIAPKHLRASEGATVMFMGRKLQLPTLVPHSRKDGSCIFFKRGKCAIHKHAPFGCRAFSACEPPSDEVELARYYGVVQLMESHEREDEYHQLTLTRPKALPTSVRRAAYRKAFTCKSD